MTAYPGGGEFGRSSFGQTEYGRDNARNQNRGAVHQEPSEVSSRLRAGLERQQSHPSDVPQRLRDYPGAGSSLVPNLFNVNEEEEARRSLSRGNSNPPRDTSKGGRNLSKNSREEGERAGLAGTTIRAQPAEEVQ
jgi:alpha-tubulin suppressor-like RCC1 family protein